MNEIMKLWENSASCIKIALFQAIVSFDIIVTRNIPNKGYLSFVTCFRTDY